MRTRSRGIGCIMDMMNLFMAEIIFMAFNRSGRMLREGFLNFTVCIRPAFTSTSKSMNSGSTIEIRTPMIYS